ncbi:MAG: hypothetical protein ACXVCY_10245 [Pseudobdellovibrionaceae bacterium]
MQVNKRSLKRKNAKKHSRYLDDDRYNQTDLAPQDSYNEIPQDRHRRNQQNRINMQLNNSPTKSFKYHYTEDDLDSREKEPKRRGHHYREY